MACDRSASRVFCLTPEAYDFRSIGGGERGGSNEGGTSTSARKVDPTGEVEAEA